MGNFVTSREKRAAGAALPRFRRILSIFLVLVLMVSAGTVYAFADEAGDGGQDDGYSEDAGDGGDNGNSDGGDAGENSEGSSQDEGSSKEESSKPESTPTPAPTPIVVPAASESFYVNDGANILSEETEKAILEKNVELNEKYGIQLVVLTVDTVGSADMQSFTKEVFRSWKIGGENGNGLLLVVDNQSNNYCAVSGAGMAKVFSDDALSTLVKEQLEPDFDAKSYDAGVGKFFTAAAQMAEAYAAENPGVGAEGEKKEENGFLSFLKGLGIFVLILVLLVLVLIVVVYIRGQMVRKKRMEQRRRRSEARSAQRPAGRGSTGRLPDDLGSGYRSSSSDKYGFDDFKPRK